MYKVDAENDLQSTVRNLARTGATREEILAVVELSLDEWETSICDVPEEAGQ